MRFLIELPTWLGDCIMSTPSIENLVRKIPEAEIIFIGSSSSIDLIKEHPNSIKTMVLDKQVFSFYKFAKQIGPVDFFISYRNSFRSKVLSFFVKTKKFYQFKKKKFSSGHQVERYNNFINLYFDLNANPQKLKIYQKQKESKDFPGMVVGLNPGAKYGSSKCWPPDRYAELACHLTKKYTVILFGGKDEEILCSRILSLIPENSNQVINLAGQTSIKGLINYIRNLDFLITGDSGPMHIAAAFNVPTVSIFGPTKYKETSQWKNDYSIKISLDLECQPCMKRECPLGHHKCMKGISVQDVLNGLNKLDREL